MFYYISFLLYITAETQHGVVLLNMVLQLPIKQPVVSSSHYIFILYLLMFYSYFNMQADFKIKSESVNYHTT